MTEAANTEIEDKTVEVEKKSAQDYYASFITGQRSKDSVFNTKDTKPVSKDDIARSTGKI